MQNVYASVVIRHILFQNLLRSCFDNDYVYYFNIFVPSLRIWVAEYITNCSWIQPQPHLISSQIGPNVNQSRAQRDTVKYDNDAGFKNKTTS